MTDPRASRRVRLSAAQRLDDLLRRAERREAAEARREQRERLEAAKREEQAIHQQANADKIAATADVQDQVKRMQSHIASLSQRVASKVSGLASIRQT